MRDSMFSVMISPQSRYLHRINSVLSVLFSRIYLHIQKPRHIWACLTSIWESVFDLIQVFFEPPTLRKVWEMKTPGPSFWLRQGVAGPTRFVFGVNRVSLPVFAHFEGECLGSGWIVQGGVSPSHHPSHGAAVSPGFSFPGTFSIKSRVTMQSTGMEY